jgi:YidC/Oxa1 family membrane protein insertase
MSALFGLPIAAAYHLVSALAGALAPLPGGLAAAAAIVAFTIMVRLLVLPLGYYAFRGERARVRLAPQVQELHRRHSKQPERLQRELSALYAGQGAGMFTGCLPTLLQLPFFTVMYRLLASGSIAGSPNVLLRQHLLGASLGSHWLTGAGPLSGQGVVFGAVFGLLVLAAVLSVRAARRWAVPAPARQEGAAGVIARLLPFGTVIIAAVVPLAAGLYLLTTAAWTAAERAVFRRLGPVPGTAPGTAAPGTAKSSRSNRYGERPGPGV